MRAAMLAVAAAVGLAVAHTSAAESGRSTKASLRLLTFAPPTVRGTGFGARERVRLDLLAPETARRRAIAGATGSFVVRFEGVPATRCDLIRVVAVGSRGSRAGLKYLPAPACMPA
jgi:hypothetical protein